MTNNVRKHGWETAHCAPGNYDIDAIEQTWLNDGFKHSDFMELWAGWEEFEEDMRLAHSHEFRAPTIEERERDQEI